MTSITRELFGTLKDGRTVQRYTLTNRKGTTASFVDYGAAWMSFQRPGDTESLVLGCDTIDALTTQSAFLGSTVGRYANRIAGGQCTLNGQPIQLDCNEGKNHLHGGRDNFTHKIWTAELSETNEGYPKLRFRVRSDDGENGFPGNVEARVSIVLTDDDEVQFEYEANTDAPTIFAMTNHVYFNLDGRLQGNLDNHEFRIGADQFVDVDDTAIPTGELIPVADTEFNLQAWTAIDETLRTLPTDRLKRAGGYDHCFCYPDDGELRELGSALSTTNGVMMSCLSDQPGLQFYSGNFLGGTPYADGLSYQQFGAFCMEPGAWPDSPNQETFPSVLLKPDETYYSRIVYAFTAL
ncbi:aldose epimerase family protein [Reinekea blandensis]|uniref:Aldose 1-epimerase n=1 Tax=Reinekea blandensis MED297 TaxID=314283 RepID=A4BFA1_9GAMM|nr:aldose epimerase family protein [Reinekea blandensis]EAR09214.1 probable aldose 1-epimerase precursor [Reinekea sp. MED297] [Reinekea blandensis MED297]